MRPIGVCYRVVSHGKFDDEGEDTGLKIHEKPIEDVIAEFKSDAEKGLSPEEVRGLAAIVAEYVRALASWKS